MVFQKNDLAFSERQILDVIGAAHECLHSIKHLRNLKLLKMDLSSTYNIVDWTFLRSVLIQSRLSFDVTNWIMGCVSSSNFDV